MAKDPDNFEPGAASNTRVSLSQVLLAPLDALFKAQVHAARSFLSFLLQVGYGDQPDRRDQAAKSGPEGSPPTPEKPSAPDTIYTMNFVQEVPGPPKADGTPGGTVLQKVCIPTLSLVPLRPLSIESAEVELAMEVTYIDKHQQMRQSVRKSAADASQRTTPAAKEPGWFLVDDPISLQGYVAPQNPAAPRAPDEAAPAESSDKRLIHIKVNVGTVPTPSGLEKLLTTLTQSSRIENVNPEPPAQGAQPSAPKQS